MQWTEVPTGQTHRAFSTFMVSLGDRADSIVTQMNTDEAFVNRLSVLCRNSGFEPSTSQARAREIMGKKIFGIEEAITHFNIAPTKRQLAFMADVPYSETTLTACKDTHILVAVFRLSGVEVREKTKSKKVFCQQDWYDTQIFANDKGYVEWHLVQKTPVDDSAGKIWDEQQSLLDENEETPKFQVLAYTVVGHFLATGERLFKRVPVRCLDLDSDDNQVMVGFGPEGFGVYNDRNVRPIDGIGVSSSRKQES